jgi:hypothetical protein
VTVSDLISGSLRLLGILASGEAPAAAEQQDAFASLNSLLDSWKLEKLMCYAILPQNFPLVAGKMSYTMGVGGDFNTEWPTRIEKVNLIYTQTGSSAPLTLDVEIIDLDQYQSFVVPSTASTIPMWVYPDSNYPLRTLYFYTVPSIVNSVDIFCWSQIDAFTDVNADITLPPGYEKALRYNLALELASEYGKMPSQIVVAGALSAKSAIKSFNMKPVLLQADNALLSHRTGFNYLTGE